MAFSSLLCRIPNKPEQIFMPSLPSSPKATAVSGQWYVLLAAILWGTTGTAQALAPAGATPIALGTMRLVIGGAALLLWALVKGDLPDGRHWPKRLVLPGAVCVAAYQLFFFAGVARTGVAVGTLVGIGSAPIVAGLLDWIVKGERPSRLWNVATLFAVSGCALLLFAGSNSQVTIDFWGILLALGAGAVYAVFALFAKELVAQHAPAAVMAVLFSLGAVFLFPLLFWVDLSWLAEPGGWLVALELGLLATAVSYLLYARGLMTVAAATAVTLSLAEPLTAAALGIFLLGETVTRPIVAGMALIFTGLALLSRVKQ